MAVPLEVNSQDYLRAEGTKVSRDCGQLGLPWLLRGIWCQHVAEGGGGNSKVEETTSGDFLNACSLTPSLPPSLPHTPPSLPPSLPPLTPSLPPFLIPSLPSSSLTPSLPPCLFVLSLSQYQHNISVGTTVLISEIMMSAIGMVYILDIGGLSMAVY